MSNAPTTSIVLSRKIPTHSSPAQTSPSDTRLTFCFSPVSYTHLGDSITVVTHPASTTHKQLSDADLTAAGVTPTLLRISLGLENADDLIEDFEQAFAQIG